MRHVCAWCVLSLFEETLHLRVRRLLRGGAQVPLEVAPPVLSRQHRNHEEPRSLSAALRGQRFAHQVRRGSSDEAAAPRELRLEGVACGLRAQAATQDEMDPSMKSEEVVIRLDSLNEVNY